MQVANKLYLALLLAVLAIGSSEAVLKSVAVLFRHGERTPVSTYPKYDNNNQLTKDLGFGQLTLKGSRQLYDLGVKLRPLYASLFPKSGYFRLSNMKIISSVPERTQQSLESFMAGFFPPPANDKTIPFPWQSFPFAIDNEGRVVYYDFVNCPKFLTDYTAANTEPGLAADWLKADSETITKIGNFLGVTLTTFMEVYAAGENIRVVREIEPSTPAWVSNAYDTVLKKYVAKAFGELWHKTLAMKQIRGGPMLTQIVNNMVATRDGNTTAKNFLIYSAHDLTVTSLATVLGITSQVPDVSSYGDTIAVEMHQNGSSEPEVIVKYISTTTSPQFEIKATVPGCGSPCRLNKFISAVSQYLGTDFVTMCNQP